MSTQSKRGTVMLSGKAYKKYVDFFNQHKEELEAREITDVSKLIRWSANEGLTVIEQKLKK